MSTSTAATLRCPRCSALLRAGSQWCSLCFADLRPAPPSATVGTPESAAPPAGPGASVPAAYDEQALAPGRPRGKHARRAAPGAGEPAPGAAAGHTEAAGPHPAAQAADPAAARSAAALADQMLAELAAGAGGSPVGRWSGLVDTKAKRTAVMVGGGLAAMALLLLGLAVLGALL